MARARNIKSQFFHDCRIAELTFEARLCFIGLWTIADREGRLFYQPKQMKFDLFATDAVKIEPMIESLEREGLIILYQVEGKDCIQIINFSKHQHPHVSEKDSDIPPPSDNGASTVKARLNTDAIQVPIRLIPDTGYLIPDSCILNPDSCSATPSAKKKKDSTDPEFDRFYARYPRKVSPKNARAAWCRNVKDEETVAAIHAALDWQISSKAWAAKQFIPHPASYLNGQRWLDENEDAASAPPPPKKGMTLSEFQEAGFIKRAAKEGISVEEVKRRFFDKKPDESDGESAIQ